MAIEEIDIEMEDLLCLIGENNTGKSAVLLALETFFTTGSGGMKPEYFRKWKTEDRIERIEEKIVVEVTFHKLTARERKEYHTRLDGEEYVLKKVYALIDEKIETLYLTKGKIWNEGWLNEEYEGEIDRNFLKERGLESILPDKGKIIKQIISNARIKYIEENQSSLTFRTDYKKNPKGIQPYCDKFIPEFHLIPAVKEAKDELKVTQTSKMGELVKSVVNRIMKRHPKFKELEKNIREIKKLFSKDPEKPEQRLPGLAELESNLTSFLKQSMDADILIEAEPPHINDIFKTGLRLSVDDGISGEIDQKGHGLQRIFIVSMFFTYAKFIKELRRKYPEENQETDFNKSLIFAFEEPELYLHPQLQRRMYEDFKELSSADQIIFCTHSPFFLNLNDYKSICILKRASKVDPPKKFQYLGELFQSTEKKDRQKRYRILNEIDPKSELFFAKKIALVEGATEKYSFQIIAKRLKIFRHDVTIVDCGSKESIPLYQMVLNNFKLPYLVIYDKDPDNLESKETSKEIETLATKGDGKTQVLTPDFGGVAESDSLRGANKKPLAAIEYFNNSENKISEQIEKITKIIYE